MKKQFPRAQFLSPRKRAPHWDVQSRFRVIHKGMSVVYVKLTAQAELRGPRACSKSFLGGKNWPVTPRYWFQLRARAALAWRKRIVHEKLKANRASETEEQRKERLRIRRENEKIENSAGQLSKDWSEVKLKRHLRLEKVVTSKQLRLAVETEKERRIRLDMIQLFWKVGNYAYHPNLMF